MYKDTINRIYWGVHVGDCRFKINFKLIALVNVSERTKNTLSGFILMELHPNHQTFQVTIFPRPVHRPHSKGYVTFVNIMWERA